MKHRKCDQAKYRKRKEREKVNKAERTKRRRALEHQEALRERRHQEERERRIRELLPYRQQLVDVLARRLYQISPLHAAKARLRPWYQIGRIFNIQRRMGGW